MSGLDGGTAALEVLEEFLKDNRVLSVEVAQPPVCREFLYVFVL